MSLQVWLPLTKDLRQQGLSNVTVTNNGATFNSAGKLGGCYSFDGSTSFIDTNINIPNFALDKAYSITCWVCPSGASGQKPIVGIGSDWSWTIFQQDTDLRFVQWDESGSRWGDPAISGVFSANTWVHIGVVWNQGVLLFYKNGEKIYEWTAPTSRTIKVSSDTVKIGGNIYAWGNNYFNGKLNDVRIYNHCLSPMEVKELAKGLVLHYPLNRNGWGQENLGNTSATYSNRTNGQTISAGGWGGDTGTVTYYHSGGYNNYPYKVYHKTATGSGGIYYKTADDINIKANTTYTMSVYIKASRNFLGDPYSFNINRGSDNYYINFGQAMQFTTEWKRIVRTFTTDANAAGQYGEMSIIYDDTAADYYIYYSGFKIEEGSVATPWCPNSSDALATTIGLNSTTEYDCSGFCNNGTRTGTFAWTSDTPKYQVSTNFNGSNYIGLIPPDSEVQTVAFWVKWSSIPSTQTIGFIDDGSGLAFGLSYGNIIVSCQAAGAASCYNASVLSANNWYHIVVVKTGATTRKLYINAVEQTTNSTTNYWSYINNELQIGKRKNTGEGIIGWMSDFRMYATALSANDVKSLYQNSAYIDSSGNVYGAVHTEV